MRKISRVAVVAAAIAAATSTTLASQAHADVAPGTGDIIGVGSDTVQNIMDFVADGDTAGDPGYNASLTNRVVSFDATPDANDRAAYLNGSATATTANPNSLKPLNPTVTLRQGTFPIQRPNGSGSGIAALLADTGSTETINYVRASRPPTAAEQATASDGNHNFGGLRVVQIATDPLAAAVATTTNAPANITAAQLVQIYECNTTSFATIGGTAGTIIPLLPQNGSGTRSTFLADLKAANNATTVPLGACVQTVEENDPTSITGATQPGTTTVDSADAIAPFSGGRLALYNSGYFHNPATVFPGGASVNAGIQLVGTNDANGNPQSYLDLRGLYIVFRANDATLTTPFQPGGTKNWAQALFIRKGSSKSEVESGAGQTLIAGSRRHPLLRRQGPVLRQLVSPSAVPQSRTSRATLPRGSHPPGQVHDGGLLRESVTPLGLRTTSRRSQLERTPVKKILMAAAATVGAAALLAISGGSAFAVTGIPPWQPGGTPDSSGVDPNNVGNLTFFDPANPGTPVTTGPAGSVFGNIVANGLIAKAGNTKATLTLVTPVMGQNPATWPKEMSGNATTFTSTTPADANGKPAHTSDANNDEDLDDYMTDVPNTQTAAGYANVFEIRISTSGTGPRRRALRLQRRHVQLRERHLHRPAAGRRHDDRALGLSGGPGAAGHGGDPHGHRHRRRRGHRAVHRPRGWHDHQRRLTGDRGQRHGHHHHDAAAGRQHPRREVHAHGHVVV